MSNCREADLRLNMARIIAGVASIYDYTVTSITRVNIGQIPDFSNGQWLRNNVIPTVGIQNPLVTASLLNAYAATTQNTFGRQFIYGNIPTNRTGTFTHSFYAKANGYNYVAFDDGTLSTFAIFDLANGVVSTAPNLGTTAIVSVGNGWYRCSLTRTYSNNTIVPHIEVCKNNNTLNFTADGVSGNYWYGYVLETGSTVTPYGDKVTIGTHSLIAGDTVYLLNTTVSGSPNYYDGLFYMLSISATAFYIDQSLSSWVSGGTVTRSAKIGMGYFKAACDANFLADGIFPFAFIHPAENQDWQGQIRNFMIQIKMDLYFTADSDASNNFVTIENTWTAVRNALKLAANWSRTGPDRMGIDGPDARTDLKPMLFVYHFDILFPAGDV